MVEIWAEISWRLEAVMVSLEGLAAIPGKLFTRKKEARR